MFKNVKIKRNVLMLASTVIMQRRLKETRENTNMTIKQVSFL